MKVLFKLTVNFGPLGLKRNALLMMSIIGRHVFTNSDSTFCALSVMHQCYSHYSDVISLLWSLQLRSYGRYSGKKIRNTQNGCQPMELSMFTASLGDLQVRAHSRRYIFGISARSSVLIERFSQFIEYHDDNGFLIEEPVHGHHLEKIRVLASNGSVITITRDPTQGYPTRI